MSRGLYKFKQTDIARAIKAVRSTGAQVTGVMIDTDGRISVQISDGSEPAATTANPWDKVLSPQSR